VRWTSPTSPTGKSEPTKKKVEGGAREEAQEGRARDAASPLVWRLLPGYWKQCFNLVLIREVFRVRWVQS
jgi:hypothetical protein